MGRVTNRTMRRLNGLSSDRNRLGEPGGTVSLFFSSIILEGSSKASEEGAPPHSISCGLPAAA